MRKISLAITMFGVRLASLLYCLLLSATAQATYIVPGARWRDTEGNIIHAYAGNVVFDQGTFWLFGEYKTEGQGEGGGVAVYSSKDLGIWQSHGLALKPIEGHPYISPGMIIQRPKVVYSEPTGKYHGEQFSESFPSCFDSFRSARFPPWAKMMPGSF